VSGVAREDSRVRCARIGIPKGMATFDSERGDFGMVGEDLAALVG